MGFEQFMQFGSGASGVAGAGMSILGGIGGFLQGHKNRKLARQLQQQQLDWQRAENERAFQRNVEMWNMQNAYNSPSEQMKRLVAAGLNPNLAYGSLGYSTASDAPVYNAAGVPSVSDAAFTNPYDSLSAAGTSLTQVSAVMSQAALNKANEKKVSAETVGEVIRNSMLPKSLETQYNILVQQYANDKEMLNVIKNNANMIAKQGHMFEVEAKKADAMIPNIKKQLEILDVDSFIRKATRDDTIKEIQAQAQITDEQAKNIASRIAIELRTGHIQMQGLEKELKMLSWDVSMREVGLGIEFQNRINSLLAEGHKIDADEKIAQALRQIAPAQAKRLINHQGKIWGDLTYFASEVLVPLLQLVPKYQKYSSFSNKWQDNRGNSSSSSGSSSTSFSW